jgi:hypothetical protein
MNTANRHAHWESVYAAKGETQVSWFQESPQPSLQLIEAAGATPPQTARRQSAASEPSRGTRSRAHRSADGSIRPFAGEPRFRLARRTALPPSRHRQPLQGLLRAVTLRPIGAVNETDALGSRPSPGLRRRAGTPPVRPFTAVRPTGAFRPVEAFKAPFCYVRNTSTPVVRLFGTNITQRSS